jgi:release factor glutamine methyltransferase
MQSPETFDMLIHRLTSLLTPEHGVQEARSLARHMVACVSNRDNTRLLRDGNLPFPQDLMPKVNNILRQLKEHIPLQYILGETEFYEYRLRVNPSVLIPRPETEELVDRVIRKLQHRQASFHLLDIGTGSGAIAIALARHLPQATVWACDISAEALATARENARLNGVKVTFFRDDILRPGTPPVERFDCIVSNPPYIPLSEKNNLQPEVKDHEPSHALFVPDDDPLLFYRAILDYAQDYLEKDGLLMVECHEKLADTVKELFREYGFTKAEVIRDINGKKRFVTGIN